MSNKILCTICARGGSKGVKNKNLRLLNGKPLIAHTIDQAKKSKLFDHIVVSSDSDEINKIAVEYGAEVIFKRPEELASDTSGKLDVIKHAFLMSEKHYGKSFDYNIDLDATSPLRDVDDIIKAYEQFISDNNDILITGAPSRRSPYFNLVEVDTNGKVFLSKTRDKSVLRRQDSPLCYDMNASIYIWRREALLNNSTLFTDKTGLYIMPEERSHDIDCELDFKIVEFLIGEKSVKK